MTLIRVNLSQQATELLGWLENGNKFPSNKGCLEDPAVQELERWKLVTFERGELKLTRDSSTITTK
jgi:hypothetical protein